MNIKHYLRLPISVTLNLKLVDLKYHLCTKNVNFDFGKLKTLLKELTKTIVNENKNILHNMTHCLIIMLRDIMHRTSTSLFSDFAFLHCWKASQLSTC